MSAAIELFDERGYEATTVAEIAERAGLTKRTFFRYFSDKREVLFSGSGLETLEIVEVAAANFGAERRHGLNRSVRAGEADDLVTVVEQFGNDGGGDVA